MTISTAILCLAASTARAQVGVGTGIGPDAFVQGERVARENMPILPIALAESLAFDATTWQAVQASTSPARDLTGLIRRGYYKLELLQAVLLASRAKTTLKDIVAAHDKGQSLRELAKAKGLDFDELYGEALRLDQKVVDEFLPSVMTVAVKPSPSKPAPAVAPERNKRKK